MNPFGLPGQHPPPKPLGGQDDIGSLQQSLLESQAAAQSGRLLSGQQGSMFHSLMGGRGLDTFSSMTALGGAGLLKPCSPPPSNNHPALARYSSVGAGRTPDTSTSRHDDLATSLQRMSRGGGQQQLNRSQQQLAENAISMLFSQNFSAAAPTATDQLMLNAARVQQDRRSLMAQRAIGIGIGSLGTAIRPSSRILGQEDAQMPGGGRDSSYDTFLRANMRDSSGGTGKLGLLQEGSGKPPRIAKAKEAMRKRAKRKIIRGSSEDEEDDSY